MLKIKLLALTLFSLVTISCENGPQKKSEVQTKEAIYKEFVAAFNSADSTQIKSQIRKHWSDTLIGAEQQWLSVDMKYWLAANKEFGALAFDSFGEDTFNDNEVAWFKGVTTKDWVGLEFDFNADNQITGTNVLRSCTPSSGEKWSKTVEPSQDYQELLKNYFQDVEQQDLFSGMVLVAKGDSIIYEGYHGFSNKELKQKLDSNNSMVIASTTKMFTAIAIAQLVEQKKLDLHLPISTYLTDFPAEIGDKVTTAHLLTHTSGVELDEIEGFMQEIEQARSIDALYATNLKYLPSLENFHDFQTLEHHDYSNENFDILGKLVEQLSGENFYTYLQTHLFDPLGMTQTGPIDMKADTSFIANGYQLSRELTGKLDKGFRNQVPASNLSFSRPAGSFYSTPRDLYKFMQGIAKGKLIEEGTKDVFVAKQVENLKIPIYKSWYGYGFYINERFGIENYGHAGGIPGGSSRCEYYPEQDVYVIVVSNYNGAGNLAANYISSLVTQL